MPPKKYKLRIGSRAQVMHGTAKMTGGGLKKKDLKYNKHGKIVSKKVSSNARKEKRLQKAGYMTQKGQFGAIRNMEGGAYKNHNSKKLEEQSTVLRTTNTSKYQVGKYVFGLGKDGKIDGFVVSIIASNESSPPKGTGEITIDKSNSNIFEAESTVLGTTNTSKYQVGKYVSGLGIGGEIDGFIVSIIANNGSSPPKGPGIITVKSYTVGFAESDQIFSIQVNEELFTTTKKIRIQQDNFITLKSELDLLLENAIKIEINNRETNSLGFKIQPLNTSPNESTEYQIKYQIKYTGEDIYAFIDNNKFNHLLSNEINTYDLDKLLLFNLSHKKIYMFYMYYICNVSYNIKARHWLINHLHWQHKKVLKINLKENIILIDDRKIKYIFYDIWRSGEYNKRIQKTKSTRKRVDFYYFSSDGTPDQDMHGTGKQTCGGLKNKELNYNKHGKIVSKKASAVATKKMKGEWQVGGGITTLRTTNVSKYYVGKVVSGIGEDNRSIHGKIRKIVPDNSIQKKKSGVIEINSLDILRVKFYDSDFSLIVNMLQQFEKKNIPEKPPETQVMTNVQGYCMVYAAITVINRLRHKNRYSVIKQSVYNSPFRKEKYGNIYEIVKKHIHIDRDFNKYGELLIFKEMYNNPSIGYIIPELYNFNIFMFYKQISLFKMNAGYRGMRILDLINAKKLLLQYFNDQNYKDLFVYCIMCPSEYFKKREHGKPFNHADRSIRFSKNRHAIVITEYNNDTDTFTIKNNWEKDLKNSYKIEDLLINAISFFVYKTDNTYDIPDTENIIYTPPQNIKTIELFELNDSIVTLQTTDPTKYYFGQYVNNLGEHAIGTIIDIIAYDKKKFNGKLGEIKIYTNTIGDSYFPIKCIKSTINKIEKVILKKGVEIEETTLNDNSEYKVGDYVGTGLDKNTKFMYLGIIINILNYTIKYIKLTWAELLYINQEEKNTKCVF